MATHSETAAAVFASVGTSFPSTGHVKGCREKNGGSPWGVLVRMQTRQSNLKGNVAALASSNLPAWWSRQLDGTDPFCDQLVAYR
jgi:hypothetical protein